MAKASIAAGADGLMIEVHCQPEEALSDGPQSLKPENFRQLMLEIKAVAEAVGRKRHCPNGGLSHGGDGQQPSLDWD